MGRFSGALLCTIAGVVTMLGDQTAAPKAAWPPLPPDFAGDFTMERLAGDAIALPIAGQFTGQFKTLSITAVADDGTVTIKDLVVDTRLSEQLFRVTIQALLLSRSDHGSHHQRNRLVDLKTGQ